MPRQTRGKSEIWEPREPSPWLYPWLYLDKKDKTEEYIKAAGLTILNQYDTEFATIFVAQKG